MSPELKNDNYQIVIKADKVPLGEHVGRFNEPTVDEVAVIMVGDLGDNRAIKTTRQDSSVIEKTAFVAPYCIKPTSQKIISFETFYLITLFMLRSHSMNSAWDKPPAHPLNLQICIVDNKSVLKQKYLQTRFQNLKNKLWTK
ncbi:helitron_like_N domain-containing protein [Nephila pilipes]|uniref:Helitron_like_N domain-containing protein n=1 Tax=Nephila pilipes TaxID=299642 RepID=A0A8X6ILA7_NEPPI|nr:helitron_like_N domain-containing protein [Nephila pilipes]